MWRWSVEHSATPASLQQPATTCAQTVKYSAKRNAHGSTPSYVDRDSLTPTVLWEGASGKTGTLPLAESITDFRELIIEGNDDDHYPRLFHTAAEAGSIVLSFVGMNFANGLASGKATLVRIADTSVQIIGHRIHVMEGNTSDTQCLTITRILGAR